MPITHSKVSAIADDPEAVAAGEVVPSDWNADHVTDGVGLWTGFPRGADGTPQVTLSYASRQVTVTAKSGSTFDIYIAGQKHTRSSPYTFAAHANAAGGHFFYFDDANVEQVVTTAWSILKHVPVAYVYYDGSRGVCFNELHSATRNPDLHERLHFVDGTQASDGFALTGYTLQGNTDAANTFAVAAGTLRDEDLVTLTTALADGGPYTVWYRTTGGAWTWDETPTLPYLHNGGTNKIDYNAYTSDWGLADVPNLSFVNYWIYGLPSITAKYQIALIMGQTTHATLAAAQNESPTSIQWGTLPFQEAAPLYRIVWRVNTGYATTGDCRIEAVDRIVGSRSSLSYTITVPPSYGVVTDGTNTASASTPASALKIRSANANLTVDVADNDPTHGDNVLLTVNGVVPVGGIIMWSGTIAAIPANWAFCDGTANAPGPDLRDKFVVGAKQDDSGAAKSNVEGSLKVSGGATGHSHSGHAALSHSGGAVADHTGFTHGLSIANHPDLTHPALSHPTMPLSHGDHAVASNYHTHGGWTLTHGDHASFSGSAASLTVAVADHSLASFSGTAASASVTNASQAGVASFASGTNRSGVVSVLSQTGSIPSQTHSHAASTLTHAAVTIPTASHSHAALTHGSHDVASFSGTHAAYTLTHADHTIPSMSHQAIGDHKATDYGVHSFTAPAAHGTAGTVTHAFTQPDAHSVSAHDTVSNVVPYFALAFIQRMS